MEKEVSHAVYQYLLSLVPFGRLTHYEAVSDYVAKVFGEKFLSCNGMIRPHTPTEWDRLLKYVPRHREVSSSGIDDMEKIVEEVKQKIDYTPPISIIQSLDFDVRIDKNKIWVLDGKNRYSISYEYRLISTRKMADFQRKYLTRFFDWSISDFGRNYYPETSEKVFRFIPQNCDQQGNKWCISFLTSKQSYEKYGNVEGGTLWLWREENSIHIFLDLSYKYASAMLEAGNFIIETMEEGKYFMVEQCGNPINVDTDIVENANQVLWSVDRYAEIDNTVLYTYDAPLVSFGKNAIFEFNGGKARKKRPSFVVNLFNNQWGTNFPQWIEGKFKFHFAIQRKNS